MLKKSAVFSFKPIHREFIPNILIMKFQINAITLVALISSWVVVAFPTEASNEGIAVADAATPKASQETPVEADNADEDEDEIAAVSSYKDYGKYANYGTYPPPGYGQYGTYGKYPSKRRSIRSTKYGSYDDYDPPNHGKYTDYHSYKRDALPEQDNDNGKSNKHGSYDGYARPNYGKYTHYPNSRHDKVADATIGFAEYTKYGKPPGGYDKYPGYVNYERYKDSVANTADDTPPTRWNYRRDPAPHRESSADAAGTVVSGVLPYGQTFGSYDGVKSREMAPESDAEDGKYAKYGLSVPQMRWDNG